ncbi:MAG: hypothetical protein ACI8X5_003710 [Planctomycetota bacterium]|jgi:hypothetical protein
MTLSGLVNRYQADVIAYLVEDNRVLKEQMQGRKLRLTDCQRRRLAAKAKALGRKAAVYSSTTAGQLEDEIRGETVGEVRLGFRGMPHRRDPRPKLHGEIRRMSIVQASLGRDPVIGQGALKSGS